MFEGMTPGSATDDPVTSREVDVTLLRQYELTYGRTPTLAAKRLRSVRAEIHRILQADYNAYFVRFPELSRQALALEAVLAKRGRCRRCGRELTNPVSIARGVGPECYGRQS